MPLLAFAAWRLDRIQPNRLAYCIRARPLNSFDIRINLNSNEYVSRTLDARMRPLSRLDPVVTAALNDVVSRTDASVLLTAKQRKC